MRQFDAAQTWQVVTSSLECEPRRWEQSKVCVKIRTIKPEFPQSEIYWQAFALFSLLYQRH
jgi:hypothetical protein